MSALWHKDNIKVSALVVNGGTVLQLGESSKSRGRYGLGIRETLDKQIVNPHEPEVPLVVRAAAAMRV